MTGKGLQEYLEEPLPVAVVLENFASFIATARDMIQGVGVLDAEGSPHRISPQDSFFRLTVLFKWVILRCSCPTSREHCVARQTSSRLLIRGLLQVQRVSPSSRASPSSARRPVQGRPEAFFSLRVGPAASDHCVRDRPAVQWLSLSLPAEPAADVVAVVVVEPEKVFAVDLEVADPEAVVAVVVVEPGVVFAVDLEVADPEVVFAAVVSLADVAGPQDSADIAFASAVLVPAFVAAVGVDSFVHPRFSAFPNSDHDPSASSSAEVAGEGSVHSSTGVRTSYGLCSVLSNPGLHHNKNVVRSYNKSNPGHNNMSDTNRLPMVATTSRSRKKCPHLYREQRTHSSYQAARSPAEVPQIRRVAAD